MNVVVFVVCIVVSLLVERAALTIAYDAAVGRRWQTIAAFLAGGMLAAVLAAVSTTVSGVAGAYGFVVFLLLLVIDVRGFASRNSAGSDDRHATPSTHQERDR